jgi:hypothetical protein
MWVAQNIHKTFNPLELLDAKHQPIGLKSALHQLLF